MLFKLAFINVKNRWRDYLVSFSGLIISAAIFYMFEAIATNQALIKGNISFGVASIVFQFGSVLLGIITLVYIVYANSFLMTMREHDYGLFIMLGGKKSRLGFLIFLETLLIGIVSTIIGGLIGIGLTKALGNLLMQLLGVQITHFNSFSPSAVFVTLIFFVAIFFVASLINQHKLLHKPVLRLLRNDTEADKPMKITAWRYVEGFLGLLLLGIGYWAMAAVNTLVLMSIPIALVTIVLGTYFLYNAFFQLLIAALRKSHLAAKGLNNFTLGQLNFRIRDYTKMLTIVSILFALALGAITVGMGYHRLIPTIARGNTAYDLVVYKKTAQTKELMTKLDLKQQTTYQRKIIGKTAYFDQSEFQAQPFQIADSKNEKVTIRQISANQVTKQSKAREQLFSLQANYAIDKLKMVSHQDFQQLTAKASSLTLLQTTSLAKSAPVLGKIANDQLKQMNQTAELQELGGAYPVYQMANLMFGGLEFMGFFLGIAFLTMLASCLMFKILSGAQADQRRYWMLNRLGARRSLIRSSIRRELGVLFLLPGILGIVHVLFGLKLFVPLMGGNPYAGLQTPFIIFLLLYLGYYLVTLFIYNKLVVPAVSMQS
ncbi:FtsX-like permease family protein [Pediococcus cellicola]|uniref:ABC superfamily ATP binding cassette transporter, permease protein n=1 Tax=Pediococcus cellicola TaxID=319652 RepID=A0A0R2IXU6_9LACO|nr:FtsX-like permease family protein [Pediococcus cellicola]KRN66596.1 ABC superfamily ATP binding cassette transporter, permease protein [Pediococcus cellicola]GEL14764.1 ABC transporter permease [Pediococcus cellicola]